MATTTLGTTRNRTELYLKYRGHARGSTRPLSPERYGHWAAEMEEKGGVLGSFHPPSPAARKGESDHLAPK